MKKRLYKSQEHRIICGVCAGIADYFNIDATLVRLLFVLAGFGGGTGILFYLAAAVIMPKNPDEE